MLEVDFCAVGVVVVMMDGVWSENEGRVVIDGSSEAAVFIS